MKRVMIVGGPGSGKSTLARQLGEATGLPVVHIDKIHWKPGWIERSTEEKTRMCREVHARPEWIFEGGHSRTWNDRAARADTLIWLDLPVGLRLWRVLRRWLAWRGRTRPDLPALCPEKLDAEFLGFILRTRVPNRNRVAQLIAQNPHLNVSHLRRPRDVRTYLSGWTSEAPDAAISY
ncbi:AAA family ATPase [Mesobaculum littorinae]|uniref:AAA family ATPase n=1 Tax=Mesobaculum littorinae TaxID=2486419 RepID=A0A438AHE5_9RHOB|nr:AAA family ATPase [Mesobaculum littorinae]RVV98094.1 AAA family ATPase [Mesobaculum littorinae]